MNVQPLRENVKHSVQTDRYKWKRTANAGLNPFRNTFTKT
jgi:hypothetical protein